MRWTIALVLIAAPLAASPAQQPAQSDSVPAELVAEGKKVFEGKSGGALCFSCHNMTGKGYPGVGPDLTDAKWLHADGTLASIEKVIRAGVTKPKESVTPMLPMGGAQLSDAQVKAVAAYVWSLSRPKDAPRSARP